MTVLCQRTSTTQFPSLLFFQDDLQDPECTRLYQTRSVHRNRRDRCPDDFLQVGEAVVIDFKFTAFAPL